MQIKNRKTRFDKVREKFFYERISLYQPLRVDRHIISDSFMSSAEYNSNNTWNFNGNNRTLNNNNNNRYLKTFIFFK